MRAAVLVFMLLVVLPVCINAAVSVNITAVSPESPVILSVRSTLYARVVYDSDQPLMMQASGWQGGHEVEAAMCNASQVYPAGHGEGLVWLAYNEGGRIDEIRAVAYDIHWQPITEASAAVQARWVATAQPAPEAPWVRELGDAQERAFLQAERTRANGPWAWLGNLLAFIMFWTVPGYPILQIIAFWRLRGWPRLISAVPIAVMLPTYAFCLDALSHGSNLWPLRAIFLSPLAFLYVTVLLLVFRRKKATPPVLEKIEL